MIKWLRNWFGEDSDEDRNVSIGSHDSYDTVGRFYSTQSGITVGPDKALTYSPVWQGLDLITGDVSRARLQVFRRVQSPWGEGKEPNRTHPAYKALRRHTGYMTTDLWLSRLVGSALMYGTGYSQIRKSTRGLTLEWLHSDQVEPRILKSRKYYIVRRHPERYNGPSEYTVQEEDMFVLTGLTLNELCGLSLVQYARNAIGRMLSAEGYADDYFANGGPAIIFTHPHRMSQEAQERFISGFSKRHQGQGNRFRVGVVEQGMTTSEVGMSAKDAQMIEAMAWGVKDIARFFNLPPHKLGDDSRTSFNSVEEENRSYLNSSLGKWFTRIEYEANFKLFTDENNFCEFKTDMLSKANTVDRWTAHNLAIQMRAKNPNEVRAEENLNPYEGGDQFLNPNIEASGENTDESTEAVADDDQRDTIKLLAREQFRVLTDRLFNQAKLRQKQSPEKFIRWLNKLDNWRDTVDDHIRHSLVACGVHHDKIPSHVSTYLQSVSAALLDAGNDASVATIEQARARVLSRVDSTLSELLEQPTCV